MGVGNLFKQFELSHDLRSRGVLLLRAELEQVLWKRITVRERLVDVLSEILEERLRESLKWLHPGFRVVLE